MFLASHLEGSAQEALADMEPTAHKEYSRIIEYFEKRFGVTARIPLYRVQLSKRHRGCDESLSSLMGQSIRRLVSMSYPKLPAQAREELAVEAFRNALGNKQLQYHVFSRAATTLTEAITLATEMEAFLDSQELNRRGRQGDEYVQSVEQPLQQQARANGANTGPPRRAFDRSMVECFGCHGFGNFRRDCRTGNGDSIITSGMNRTSLN